MPEQEPAPLLLCLDLEAGSEALARQAAELARRCRRPVRILHVSDGHPVAEERKGIEAALARIREEMLTGIEITGVRSARASLRRRSWRRPASATPP
jgi:Universal stress protein family.